MPKALAGISEATSDDLAKYVYGHGTKLRRYLVVEDSAVKGPSGDLERRSMSTADTQLAESRTSVGVPSSKGSSKVAVRELYEELSRLNSENTEDEKDEKDFLPEDEVVGPQLFYSRWFKTEWKQASNDIMALFKKSTANCDAGST